MRKGQHVRMLAGKYAGQTITLTHRWPGSAGEWSGTLDVSHNSAIVNVRDMDTAIDGKVIIREPKPVLASLAEQFNEMFGVRLAPYWLGPLRLDVVKFDEEIVKPRENESTVQAIERRWGKNAVELIRALL